MVPFAGYEMPVQYKGVTEEHHAVRKGAGVFDVSHMGELDVQGEGAEAFIDSLVTADLSKLPIGKAVYTMACNEGGTILDDLIVYRKGATSFLVVCNASNRSKIVAHFQEHHAGRSTCTLQDISDDTALLALQGPHAAFIMARLAPESTDLKSFEVKETNMLGHSVFIARTGYTAEDGFEIFCANDAATPIFTALISDTQGPEVAMPIGLGARDTLRLEGRLSLYGNEIDETTNPFEAGLSWVVKLQKERDFVGKAALIKLKENPGPKTLVGFEMIERGIARHGYVVVNEDGKNIGLVTSGSPSPTLGVNIGLAYVPRELSAVGSEILIQVRDKSIKAKVVPLPFYKRAKG